MTFTFARKLDACGARTSRSRTRVLVVLSLAAGATLAGCRGKGKADEAPPTHEPMAEAAASTTPPPGLSAKALHAYEAAKVAIRAANLDEARDLLKQAVEVQPDFTEAWYNLGATTSRLSMAAAGDARDQEAIALFREAVDEKRRAQALIDEGKWFVYKTREEQDQVIDDLRHALEDAEAVLADESSLLVALRLWAASGRVR